MNTVFISDLHLHPSKPDVADYFLRYLQVISAKTQSLYILGDLFDAWIGDDYKNEFSDHIIRALAAFSSSGKQLFLMHGNRDFLLGEQFCRTTGATLLTDPCVIDLHGEQVLLMHGDSLCVEDTAYQKFRKMVRDPVWQSELLARPVEERLQIAQGYRNDSRLKNQEKSEDIMDVTASEVQRIMSVYDVRLLIHGHTHRPNRHAFNIEGEPAERIVLGDWDNFGWALTCSNTDKQLAKFGVS